MRRWVALLALLTLVPSSALMQEKGGEDEFGPYEVVANWPQPIPGTEGYTWGSTGGVFAETPDRVWIVQRGMLPLPPAPSSAPRCRQRHRRAEPEVAALHLRRRSQRADGAVVDAARQDLRRERRARSA